MQVDDDCSSTPGVTPTEGLTASKRTYFWATTSIAGYSRGIKLMGMSHSERQGALKGGVGGGGGGGHMLTMVP